MAYYEDVIFTLREAFRVDARTILNHILHLITVNLVVIHVVQSTCRGDMEVA